MDRRTFLTRSAALGCGLGTSPLVAPITFAATPGNTRLVVILLRGGMDGLGALIPYGDPEFARLRPEAAVGKTTPPDLVDLDGFFALHPALHPLLSLWTAGQLAAIHAVSTPYRDKRSHFDGQDILEVGHAELSSRLTRDGWLNRVLQRMPDHQLQTAYAVGNDPLMLMQGSARVRRWAPDADLLLSPQALRLAQLVTREDPELASALQEALQLAGSDDDPPEFKGSRDLMMAEIQNDMRSPHTKKAETGIAEFVAERLRGDARIAAFSLNGWDSHAHQDRALTRALSGLAQVILGLNEGLGPKIWSSTAIVAVTEFGRTVRMNGTGGTDHGTGGAMILAGGAIRGGRVYGDWPGLTETDLYQRRDLMPTADLRSHLGWLIRGLFGLEVSTIENLVFPGLDLGPDAGLIA